MVNISSQCKKLEYLILNDVKNYRRAWVLKDIIYRLNRRFNSLKTEDSKRISQEKLDLIRYIKNESDINKEILEYFKEIKNLTGFNSFEYLNQTNTELTYDITDFHGLLNKDTLFLKEIENKVSEIIRIPTIRTKDKFIFRNPMQDEFGIKKVETWSNYKQQFYKKHFPGKITKDASKYDKNIDIRKIEKFVFSNGIGYFKKSKHNEHRLYLYAAFNDSVGYLSGSGKESNILKIQIDRNSGNKRYISTVHGYPIGEEDIINKLSAPIKDKIITNIYDLSNLKK